MRILPITLLLWGCGSDNDIDVNGGTTNTVVVEYRAPLCEQPPFETVEDKLKCIRALTTYKVDGKLETDGLTDDQLDAITDEVGIIQ